MTRRVLLYSRVNPADRGGVQAVYRRLGQSLVRAGHTVRQAWALPDPAAGPSTVCWPLPSFDWAPGPARARRLAGALKAAVRLATRLARYRPHVVNVHFVTGEALYFAVLRTIFRYRLVLSVHGSDVLRPKPWDAPLLPWIMGRADAITTVSHLTARKVMDEYRVSASRVHVVPNGIDYSFWSAAGSQEPVERRPVVLTVGRLHPVKGQDLLLRAFARLGGTPGDARVLLVGDGGWRGELEQLARDLGIRAQVDFTGQLDAWGVRSLMAEAACLAMPSRSEGLPLILLEAMAAGLPVVATRVGGIPEVVDEQSAWLVPPEDAEQLAAALAHLLHGAADVGARVRSAHARARLFDAAGADAAYEQLLLPAVA